jgi:hypothetical protein
MISVDLPATRTFTSNNARAIATELGIDLGALGRDLQRWGSMSGPEHEPRDPRVGIMLTCFDTSLGRRGCRD